MADVKHTGISTHTVRIWSARCGSSWCRITLDDTDGAGSVTVDSDHGRWGYNWPAKYRGDRDLAAFVATCDDGYLAAKFKIPDELDPEATRAEIRGYLDDGWCSEPEDWKNRERDLVEDIDSEGAWNDWLDLTSIPDAWEMRATRRNRAWGRVYDTYWPAFRAEALAGLDVPDAP